MFAVIETGGKQYKVQEGDVLAVEKLKQEEGQKVTFDRVLLVDEEGKTLIGTPHVKNALVKAEIIENFKDKKVIVFKKKRRKQYKKKRGHRQELTRIKIEQIVSGLKAVPKTKPAADVKKDVKKPAPKVKKEVSAPKAKELQEEAPKKKEKKAPVKKASKAPTKLKAAKPDKPTAKAASRKKPAEKASTKAKTKTLKKEK
ncbi:MAG: 50S ribosomal protein L21 [Candidatus Aminicenantes bacterium]|jgi:large subunit ribosomal protein L21